MICLEIEKQPDNLTFEVAFVAVGYERRGRWVTEKYGISAEHKLGLEFGFLAGGSFGENKAFFESRGFSVVGGLDEIAIRAVAETIVKAARNKELVRVFVDISSMSREMIANVILGVNQSRVRCRVTAAYAPSKFNGQYEASPITLADPIKPSLAGWSAQPERPLGTIFGLGCEPGLALGALQVLEPTKAWVFQPKGIDRNFDATMKAANKHLGEIFDVSPFDYAIMEPAATRARLESLLSAIEGSFRLIIVPFGPKIFAWLSILTAVLRNKDVGVWAFSSKQQGRLVDRSAEGSVVWHTAEVCGTLPGS